MTNGAIVQRLDYDSWGRVLLDTNPGFQPFGFAGGLYDPETGLERFGGRDYDATRGTWLRRDSDLSQLDRISSYSYCYGDPVDFVDPWGMGFWDDVWSTIQVLWATRPEVPPAPRFLPDFRTNANPYTGTDFSQCAKGTYGERLKCCRKVCNHPEECPGPNATSDEEDSSYCFEECLNSSWPRHVGPI